MEKSQKDKNIIPDPYEDMIKLEKLDPYETQIKSNLFFKEKYEI